MVYYDGGRLTENMFSRRLQARKDSILCSLRALAFGEEFVGDWVPTNRLWLHLVGNGYLYDYRTLHKDLAVLEFDGFVVSDVFHGGKGKGTVKSWKVKE